LVEPPHPQPPQISASPRTKPHQRRENVAHGASRGMTAHREHAEPRSGDRRSAIIKTALSPHPGLFRRIGLALFPRLSPWATFLRPSRRAPGPDRGYSSAYAPQPLSLSGERVDRDGAFISRSGTGEGAGYLPNPQASHSRFNRTTQIPFAASGASSVSSSPDCLNVTFSWPFKLRASRTGHGTRTEIFAAAARSE